VKKTRIALLLSLLLACPWAAAQAPAAPAAADPKFDIQRFIVEGASLVTAQEIDTILAPFAGKRKDFSDVQRALEALERAYTTKGYSAVQVILPEQELEKGEVRFKVVEAKVGKLVIEGNKFFDDANVRNSLPSLSPGSAPNINRIAEDLRLANESPAKQTTVLLRGGADEGLVDAVVRVSDERPYKASLTFDNTGTPQTGIFRLGVGFQYSNLLNRDHVLSMQYVTSPHQHDRPNEIVARPNANVFIFGLSYHIPIYSLGDSIDMSTGYSNVNSGVVQNLFNVSGSGTIFGLRYNFNLPRWGELEHKFAFGYDWRDYSNRVTPVGGSLGVVPDVSVHPVSVTYGGVYRTQATESGFNLGFHKNMPWGADGDSAAFQASRNGAIKDYFVTRWGVNHSRAFANDWQMRIALNGQMTRHKLVAGEQFGIGGSDSVRGFLEREVSNDNGSRGTIEFYTPDIASKFSWLSGLRIRGVTFYDWGRVSRKEPAVGELQTSGIASYGIGVRVSSGVNVSLRFDFAVVSDSGGSQGKSEGRAHASFAYVF